MRTLFFILLLLVQPLRATTFLPATGGRTDVAAAIALTVTGDTVRLPAGTFDWGSAPLVITNAIYVTGAGTNLADTNVCTFIYGAGTLISWSSDTDNKIRLSSIVFSNSAAQPTVIFTGANLAGGNSKMTQVRVDHCIFERGKRAIWPKGYVYGVADQNMFFDCDIAVAPQGDEAFSWARPGGPGSTNAFFTENSLFYLTLSLNQQLYHQGGARSVIRNNRFVSINTTNTEILDSHGNWAGGGPPVDPDSAAATTINAQFFVEFYGNTIDVQKMISMTIIRGGQFLAFSNYITYATGSRPIIYRLGEEEAWQTAFFNPLRTVWPAQQQITNSFLWATTVNGSPITSADVKLWNGSSGGEQVFIQENRDWWLQSPNATNGSPAGVLASYAPAAYPHPLATFFDGAPAAPSTINNFKLSGSWNLNGATTLK